MANDFSSEGNCKALWRVEDGALTTDSKGTNTLTAGGTPAADTGDYMEGAASVDYDGSSYHSITDANLDAGFPLKNGVTTRKITLCFWFKPDVDPTSQSWHGFIHKGAANQYSLAVNFYSNGGKPALHFGHDAGVTETIITWPTACAINKWYWVCVRIEQDGSDIDYYFYVWDEDAGDTLGSNAEQSGTKPSKTWNIEDATLYIGSRGGAAGYHFEGRMDEIVVLDRVVSDAERDQIRAATFGSSSSSSSASSSSQSSSSSSLSSSSLSSSSLSSSSSSSSHAGPTDNKFSEDSHCAALWRFESGALGIDSIGGNHVLPWVLWPNEMTSGQREGACCADFELDSDHRLFREDAYLALGFPLKANDVNREISVACWFKPETLPDIRGHLFCKGLLVDEALGRISFSLAIGQQAGHYRIGFGCGFSYGWEWEVQWIYDGSIDIVAGQWYHVAVTYDDDTQIWQMRVYDLEADESAFSHGTTLLPIVVDEWNIWIGKFYDGLLDELVIFNDALNPTEMAQIQQGIYDGGYSSSSSESSSSESSSSSSFSSSSESSWSLSSSSESSATARTWPTLSRGYDLEIVEEVDDDGIGASDPQYGQVLTTPNFYRAVHRLRLSMRYLSQADRVTLERWILETTIGTVHAFEVTHPKTAQTWLVRFDPAAPPRWATEPKNMEKHRFEAELLEDIGDGYLMGIYL